MLHFRRFTIMRLVYSLPDGTITVVTAAEKSKIEQMLGELSDDEYKKHIYDRSIPSNALNVREIQDSDLPSDREFRNAWCDTTPLTSIDIDCSKARDLKLDQLRAERNIQLDLLDKQQTQAQDLGTDLTEIKNKKQKLRDATNQLKALTVTGIYNDENVLNEIKKYSILDNVI